MLNRKVQLFQIPKTKFLEFRVRRKITILEQNPEFWNEIYQKEIKNLLYQQENLLDEFFSSTKHQSLQAPTHFLPQHQEHTTH